MVKPRTQVKTAVKAKTVAASAEAAGRPEDEVGMAMKGSEDMKKLLRAQAREAAAKEPAMMDEESFENDS